MWQWAKNMEKGAIILICSTILMYIPESLAYLNYLVSGFPIFLHFLKKISSSVCHALAYPRLTLPIDEKSTVVHFDLAVLFNVTIL